MSVIAKVVLNRLTSCPETAGLSGSIYYFTATRGAHNTKKACEMPGMTCCKANLKGCERKEKRKCQPEEEKIPPECVGNPCCPDPPIKYDEEFAELLKHKERTEFQRTWKECPPRRTICKVICGEPAVQEIHEECKKKEQPKVEPCESVGGRCPKITMPGCKPAFKHKQCKNWPAPSCCEKIKAPYPSFSECSRPKPKPKHPTECECLAMRSLCEAYNLMRKKGKKIKVKQN